MSLNTQNKIRLGIIGIVLLTLFAGLIDWHVGAYGSRQEISVPSSVPASGFWNKFNYHLGLDLQGGTHLVYQADVSQVEDVDKDSAMEGVRDVIERRVNAFGVSEPVVQTNKVGDNYRVIIELAGVTDVNQAITMIGETPLLEFKEENPAYSTAETTLTDAEQAQLDQENKTIEDEAKKVLAKVKAGDNFEKLAQEYSDDPGSASNGGDIGWVKKGMLVPEYEKAIFDDLSVNQITPALVKTQFGYHIIKKDDEKIENGEVEVKSRHILFKTKTAYDIKPPVDQWLNTQLTGKYLKKALVQYDNNSGAPEVSLEFDDEGAKLFEDITARNIGKPVAIFLDGSPISVPNVNEKISGGKAVITGRFNLKEAKQLAQRLNAGALPVPITLLSQQTVGPSLGQESIDQSFKAGIVGLILVILFMIIYYRLPGLLSAFALVIYTLLTLALFKIMSITLTLAGIAGFILSIGIAVDANVLIFERLKEELRAGRDLSTAVNEGFKRAWSSIRDSNISTLLTCLILIWFGTSIIKGFAITLSIGIIVSMFSAITVTRTFLKGVVKGNSQGGWWFGFKKENKQ